MHAWQKVFREGLAIILPTAGLEALASALASDSIEVIQNGTTLPPPLQHARDEPIEKACPVAFALWRGCNLRTVGEVEEAFALTLFKVDELLGQPAAVRYFLNWVDETERARVRRELLAEVNAALLSRKGGAA